MPSYVICETSIFVILINFNLKNKALWQVDVIVLEDMRIELEHIYNSRNQLTMQNQQYLQLPKMSVVLCVNMGLHT